MLVLKSTTSLDRHMSELSLSRRLEAVRAQVPGRFVFTTSFGLEDQALAQAIFTITSAARHGLFGYRPNAMTI